MSAHNLPEAAVFSRREIATGRLTRPSQIMGHAPSEQSYPFVLALTGVIEPLASGKHDDTSSIEIVSVPQAIDEGVVFATHVYATLSEAVIVGDAFPEHTIYARLLETWRQEMTDQNADPSTLHTGNAVGRYALDGVYLFGPASRIGDLMRQPTFEAQRLSTPSDNRFRYIFARGTNQAPLVEVIFEPEIHHTDLQVPDYALLMQLVQNRADLNLDYIGEEASALALAHQMPPTASRGDLTFVSALASQYAAQEVRALGDGEYKDALYDQERRKFMAQVFGLAEWRD